MSGRDVAAMALVLFALGVVMLVARALRERFGFHPELSRKLVHVAMGCIVLSFPWLFREALPVAILGVLAVGALLLARVSPPLRSVIGGVSRVSFGDVLFPAAVAILFPLAQGHVLLYVIPVLILTFADAVSALVGLRYGFTSFRTFEGERKSLEGSLAFFTFAFLAVHVPLLLFSTAGRAETLLIALNLGLLIMLVEAVSWRGIDNLLIPLGSFLLLRSELSMEVTTLALHLGVTLLLALLLFCWRRYTTLDASGLLAAVLIAYAMWVIGGWRSLPAPLILFVTYGLVFPRSEEDRRGSHDLMGVVSVAAAGLVWIFLGRVGAVGDVALPYTISFAAQLSLIGVAWLTRDFPRMPRPLLVGACALKGWGLIALPWALLQGLSVTTALQCAVALGAVVAASTYFSLTQPKEIPLPVPNRYWLRQALTGAVASLAGLIV